MSIYRLKRSMVLVNEGIDRVDIPLILEATKDFEAGLSELIKSIEGFLDAVESFKEIKSWVSPLNFTLENLKKIDIKNLLSMRLYQKLFKKNYNISNLK